MFSLHNLKKITWTKYQTNCKFLSFYLFRSLITTKWAGLFLRAALVPAVLNKELLSHLRETPLVSPWIRVISPPAWALPFSLPLPSAFHRPPLLLAPVTSPTQRGQRFLGSGHTTQRIRRHPDITWTNPDTQKDQLAQNNSVTPIQHPSPKPLGSFGRPGPFCPQRALASEVLILLCLAVPALKKQDTFWTLFWGLTFPETFTV